MPLLMEDGYRPSGDHSAPKPDRPPVDLPATAAARIDLSTDRLIVVAAGWLGIMVGSRLYFRLVGEVLTDDARYEAVMDDVVQEVRRRAPSASAGRAINAGEAQVPRPAQRTVPAAARPVEPSVGCSWSLGGRRCPA